MNGMINVNNAVTSAETLPFFGYNSAWSHHSPPIHLSDLSRVSPSSSMAPCHHLTLPIVYSLSLADNLIECNGSLDSISTSQRRDTKPGDKGCRGWSYYQPCTRERGAIICKWQGSEREIRYSTRDTAVNINLSRRSFPPSPLSSQWKHTHLTHFSHQVNSLISLQFPSPFPSQHSSSFFHFVPFTDRPVIWHVLLGRQPCSTFAT